MYQFSFDLFPRHKNNIKSSNTKYSEKKAYKIVFVRQNFQIKHEILYIFLREIIF